MCTVRNQFHTCIVARRALGRGDGYGCEPQRKAEQDRFEGIAQQTGSPLCPCRRDALASTFMPATQVLDLDQQNPPLLSYAGWDAQPPLRPQAVFDQAHRDHIATRRHSPDSRSSNPCGDRVNWGIRDLPEVGCPATFELRASSSWQPWPRSP